MKAVLRYTDCLKDRNKFFAICAQFEVEVLKTKTVAWSIDQRVTVYVKDRNMLNSLLIALNQVCTYGVICEKLVHDNNAAKKIKRSLIKFFI